MKKKKGYGFIVPFYTLYKLYQFVFDRARNPEEETFENVFVFLVS